MTDKQIIIDCVNVSGWTDGEVYYKLEHYSPKATKQIAFDLYKQLKRKEQECEELKAKFQDMKKSRDIALKEYNEEFEYKRQITVEHLEQKKELLKQLDQLKTENEELKKQNNQFDNGINEQFSKIIELEGRNNLLKQILTEIKEIAEKQCVCGVDCIDMKQILQKISECGGNNEYS